MVALKPEYIRCDRYLLEHHQIEQTNTMKLKQTESHSFRHIYFWCLIVSYFYNTVDINQVRILFLCRFLEL